MPAGIFGRNEEDQGEGRRANAGKQEDNKEEKLVPAKKELKEEEKMLHPRKEVVFSSLPYAHALTIQVHFPVTPLFSFASPLYCHLSTAQHSL